MVSEFKELRSLKSKVSLRRFSQHYTGRGTGHKAEELNRNFVEQRNGSN